MTSVLQSPLPRKSHFNSNHAAHSSTTTPDDLARRFDLKPQNANGAREWHGANPFESGATHDGFLLNEDGTAFDRKLNRKYKSREVAQLAGLRAEEYEPCAA